MRKLFLILLLICTNNLLAQIVIIKDSLLNTPIENANLISKNSGAVSNKTGAVDITFFNNDEIIEISHVSYHSKKVIKKNVRSSISLRQKTNMLPAVVLNEEIKLLLSKKRSLFTVKPFGLSLLESQTANLLTNKTSIVVQENQPGGGSPNYRGMEANRLLLVIDGIALNNAIYRSGHLQNSATINPFFIESFSLLSGPASVVYGNGAMGGALIFNTHSPSNKKKICFHQQFESSSNTTVSNFQTNYYTNNLYHITAFSLKSAGNLRMGSNRFHGYKNWGNEKIVTNKTEQLYTSYNQIDFMHKSLYKINDIKHILFNTQYSRSSAIYRFDKMNDIKTGVPKYQKWYYGPQIRFLQKVTYSHESKTVAFDKIKTTLAFQKLKESRHTQALSEELLNNRNESIGIYDFTVDFNKKIKAIKMAYGIGYRGQKISSTASLNNNSASFYNPTRYPDGGSTVKDFFAYSQANFQLNKKLDLLIGARWNNNKLLAQFNNPSLNFQTIENNNSSFINSILLSYGMTSNTTINASYYGGFRNPNVDDIGKIFSKDGINVVVPNAKLNPEYTNNFEITVDYALAPLKLQIQLFNTQITNAINREIGTLNGLDSMFYDGQMMRVQMNKNIESANINGISLSADFSTYSGLLISVNCNYLTGTTSENKPLAHIPPFNAKISFNYQLKQHEFDVYTNYNAWKLAVNYDDAGIDNLSEATSDGTPEWYTLNVAYANKITKAITFTFAIKNILDAHYKTFSSGLSASGRNFIFSLQTSF